MKVLEQGAATAEEISEAKSLLEHLPADSGVRDLMLHVLDVIADGAGVTVVEQDRQLSPADIAELLQVSRPHVMKLINLGLIESTLVGTHHRVAYPQFVDYLKRRDRASLEAATVFAAAAQKKAPAVKPLSDAARAELAAL